MVVLSVALCTKTGKSLFARQFVDMQRGRVEGLLAAFPKLVGSAGTAQHTYVETDAVRYVYHPVDSLYIVLVTNKQSNIMEDLDTLRLLAKLVPNICPSTSYDAVQAKVFDILMAFDEVITSGGYKEDITLRQVRSNMEMNSHDERLAKLIRQSKINEARETAAAKAKALSEARKHGVAAGGYMDGFGRDSGISRPSFSARADATSSSGGGSSSRYSSSSTSTPKATAVPASSTRRARRGMKLGSKKKKGDSMLASLMQEEHIPAGVGAASAAAGAAAVEESKGPVVDVEVAMAEKFNAAVLRDGSVKKMQVAGTMSLTCGNPDATQLRLAVTVPDDSGFQFQPHPNVSKPAWKTGIIALKDPSRSFPVGTAASLLRWRQVSRSDTDLPIALNVWPDALDDSVMTVTVDYTLNRTDVTLSDVTIRIPLPVGSTPNISQCDGQNNHVTRDDMLEWTHVLVDSSNAEGTLEFEIPCDDESAFFPVQVSFTAKQCLCPLAITAAERVDAEGNTVGPATFRASQSLVVASYTIAEED